jgi:hypothetical protein
MTRPAARGRLFTVAVWAALAGCAGPRPAARPDGDPRASAPWRVRQLISSLDIALLGCPDRVWPGSSRAFRASQVLIVDNDAGRAWLWNDQRAERPPTGAPVTAVDRATLAPRWWASTYTMGNFADRPTLGLTLPAAGRRTPPGGGGDPFRDEAIQLALHEGFHYLSTQPSWPASRLRGGLALPYPEDWVRRYLRAALRQEVQGLARGEPGATLAAAAFWQDRLRAEQRRWLEGTRSSDILEGTAQYAAVAMAALVARGCGAGDHEVREAMLAYLPQVVPPDVLHQTSEPYALGLLAALALRREARADWHARAERGETPVEILVGGVTPVAQADDLDLMTDAQEASRAHNERCRAQVAPALVRLKSAQFLRLPLPYAWRAGSFRVSTFVTLVEEPGTPEAMLGYSGTYAVPGGAGRIEVVDQTVVALRDRVCPGEVADVVLTIPAEALAPGGAPGTYSVNKGPVTFRALPATIIRDAKGLSWLCPSSSTTRAAR